jgi:hypothetical protein
MPEVDLATLADAGAFVSHEHQAHLAEVVRIGDWQVDAASGMFAFVDGDGVARRVRAHLIGTSSPEEGTWLWGWANVNGFPQAFVRQSERVRSLGERYAIPEFTTASLPLDDRLPQTLVDAVKAVTGLTAHYSAPTGNGGTRAWLLLDDPSLALPAPTAARAVAVVTTALADGGVVDHRRALTAWAEQRGVGLERLDADLTQLTLADGSLQVRFDEADRIAGLGRRLRPVPVLAPEPEPAPEPGPAPEPQPERVAELPEAPPPQAPPQQPLGRMEQPEPVGPPPRRGLLQRLLGR